MVLTFSETEIQALFGHEAAEDEDPQRLRSYYFKTATYDEIANDLQLRILVGHKGIGKSALFQVAMAEDREAGRIAILIRPDDVADLGTDTTDFLRTIRSWKRGLLGIIASKVLGSFGSFGDETVDKLKRAGGGLLELLRNAFQDTDKLNVPATEKRSRSEFSEEEPINCVH